ncbi:MAG TPA: SWIM zinc finger domain-containing protein, partial [Chloroflexota bacterium]
ANWLVDLASELGKADLALSAAVVGFKAQMDLATYQRVQSLAGARWTEYQEDLLAHLRQPPAYLSSSAIDVFLHEQLIDDAIAAVDRSGGYDTIERVARAAVATRPDWVVRTCRSQAERIMDAAKAQSYGYAIRWLEIARDAYGGLDQSKEWQVYLQGLIAEHARKYKLRPMLEKLR